ncbi:MAG TPA: cation:dicarboxylase symporter family transporter, partial [Sphingobium sp.]|nr:cation:dicarboxylase symporter family transporter [Sphingobium sp.]
MSKAGRFAFSLQWRMLAGFLAGLILGLMVHAGARDSAWVDSVTRYVTGPIGQIFLRLLFMLVIPLLLSALIVGIAEMGEMRSLRRVGLKTLAYTLIVSSIAVAISLAAVNLLRPGDGVDPAQARAMLDHAGQGAQAIMARSGEAPKGMD